MIKAIKVAVSVVAYILYLAGVYLTSNFVVDKLVKFASDDDR